MSKALGRYTDTLSEIEDVYRGKLQLDAAAEDTRQHIASAGGDLERAYRSVFGFCAAESNLGTERIPTWEQLRAQWKKPSE